jgi:hypothetical protein
MALRMSHGITYMYKHDDALVAALQTVWWVPKRCRPHAHLHCQRLRRAARAAIASGDTPICREYHGVLDCYTALPANLGKCLHHLATQRTGSGAGGSAVAEETAAHTSTP